MKSCTSTVQNRVFPFLPFTKHRSLHQPRFMEQKCIYATFVPFLHQKSTTHVWFTLFHHDFTFFTGEKLSKSVIWTITGKLQVDKYFGCGCFSSHKVSLLLLLWNLPMVSDINAMLRPWVTSPGGLYSWNFKHGPRNKISIRQTVVWTRQPFHLMATWQQQEFYSLLKHSSSSSSLGFTSCIVLKAPDRIRTLLGHRFFYRQPEDRDHVSKR